MQKNSKSIMNLKQRIADMRILMNVSLFLLAILTAAAIVTLVLSTIGYTKVNHWNNCDIDDDCTDINVCTVGWCDKGKCNYFSIDGCCVGTCTGQGVNANYEFDTICANQINVCNNLTSNSMISHSEYDGYQNYAIGDGTLKFDGNLEILGNIVINGTLNFSNITLTENSTLSELFNSFTENLTPNITVGGTLNGSLINSTVIKLGKFIHLYFESVSFVDCHNDTLSTPVLTLPSALLPYNPQNETISLPFTVINNGENTLGTIEVLPTGQIQWKRFDLTTGILENRFLGNCGFLAGWINFFTA